MFFERFFPKKALKSLFFGILRLLNGYSCTHLYVYHHQNAIKVSHSYESDTLLIGSRHMKGASGHPFWM